METFTADAEAHDIGPHSLWRVPVPSDSIEAKGQALNVKNSVQVFIFQVIFNTNNLNYNLID